MEDADGRGKGSSWKPLKILVKTKTRERERERGVCEQRLSLQLSTSDRSSISENSKGQKGKGEGRRARWMSDRRSDEDLSASDLSPRTFILSLYPQTRFSRLFTSRMKPGDRREDGQEKWVNYRVISPEK